VIIHVHKSYRSKCTYRHRDLTTDFSICHETCDNTESNITAENNRYKRNNVLSAQASLE
jgi:hypothetical protein